MKRRFFLFAAPAIVAAPSLMRVSTLSASLTDWKDVLYDLDFVNNRMWQAEQSVTTFLMKLEGSDEWTQHIVRNYDTERCIVHLSNAGDTAIVLSAQFERPSDG